MLIASRLRLIALGIAVCLLGTSPLFAADAPAGRTGYYRYPALHGDTLIFTSEGDLWSVPLSGGVASRLTSAPGIESMATISPDGQTVAFRAQYEGPNEVYTMPIHGGLPQRRTWSGTARPDGWTPDGRLIISTTRYSTLPDPRLALISTDGQREIVPLAGAAEAAYLPDGHTLIFTRWYKQPSNTKRYKGGSAENLWSYDGHGEAVPLTADYTGTSHDPMVWNNRIYFLSDRDGVMNVYSIDPHGHDLKQETHQHTFDVETASISDGHLVYACAGALWSLDLSTGHDTIIPITLLSDFDQLQTHWVKEPLDYLTGVHISPDGSRAVFSARGEVFTVPAKTGRIIKIAGDDNDRYSEARFLPDGKSIIALSTATGETEFWKYPADGFGKPEQWTHDSKILTWDGLPSPDGKWLAHYDKNHILWLYNIETKQDKQIAQSNAGDFSDLAWSPDSQWLAYVESADNLFDQIHILNASTGALHTITDDRYNSESPAFSADGKWLYFLSDRMLKTTVGSPWGARMPAPHFDRAVEVYELALTPGLRSPFLPSDELHPDDADKSKSDKSTDDKSSKPDAAKSSKSDDKSDKSTKAADDKSTKPADKKPTPVTIDFTDISARLTKVPAPAGNYDNLQLTDKRLCWLNHSDDIRAKLTLQCLDIANKGDNPDTVMSDVRGFEISLDRKKMLVSKEKNFYIFDSDVKGSSLNDAKNLSKAELNLSHWTFSTNPRQEFRSLFLDAWRLERDYYYDPSMQGINWPAMRDRYLPLVDRVSDRDELNDIIAQMVSELSTLHTFVFGGDHRKPANDIDIATLGAELHRDEKAGGYVVDHIYLHDPDLPTDAPPFARPESLVHQGEVILSIDGQSTLSVPDERALLRGKAGTQVMLRVKSTSGEVRDALVTPIDAHEDATLRYAEWEYTRRLEVDSASHDDIGYVHLQAMGPNDIDQWARDYYPVFNRQGLIIDVRHNHGGNIDSWLLSTLLRKAWFYWQPRNSEPMWNMQGAFRGHIVVLCDEDTASDGEAFAEGFKRLHMGKIIGTRTWGGEIWLSTGDTAQEDGGVASAAETGVYGPEGKQWLIEGHGVDPDITVDNLPHATYTGEDAQLQAAIKLLQQEIKDDPNPVPPHPPYPNKSFDYKP
ncbi:MAG: S41 family peptidase [Acidobacteriaceae bacterium]